LSLGAGMIAIRNENAGVSADPLVKRLKYYFIFIKRFAKVKIRQAINIRPPCNKNMTGLNILLLLKYIQNILQG
jgi:hypothetical protein